VAKKSPSDESPSSSGDAATPSTSPSSTPAKKTYPGVKQLDLAAEAPASRPAADTEAAARHEKLVLAREKLMAQLGIVRGKPTYTKSLDDPGHQSEIVGVGVGLRYSQKSYTPETVLKVFVTDKLRDSAIHPDQMVPKFVDGIPTDVEEMAPGRPHDITSSFPLPVPCGVGCGNQTGSEIGTIGCLVLLQNGNLCILSNNHVLANATGDLAPPRAQIGDPIFQPGNRAGSFIARLDDYVPYSSSRPNVADAAVALTSIGDAVNPQVGFSASGNDPLYVINPTPMEPAEVFNGGLNVMKYGARTQGSVGIIVTYGVQNVPMDYLGYGRVFFDDVVVIATPGGFFSDQGDSGSLIVEFGSKRPVALLMGGVVGPNGAVTYANPISHVMDALNISKIISSPDDLSS
jgi:hypothetical protein